MARLSILALISTALIALPAIAQTAPEPRTDIPALLKEAKADPAIAALLADRTRSMDSRLRDEPRYTALILKAAGAKPGDRVLDVGSGGGYLALLFSTLVGEKGHVDIHNTPGWINQFPSMDPDFQKQRITRRNIGWLTTRWTDIDAPPASYDLIVMGQVYHDVFLEGESPDIMNQRLFAMLKPGGRIVIEDHDAIETMHLAQQANLHRISHGDVTGQLIRAGFVLKDMILIDSSYDDRRFNVFRPGVRGRTDRFIATFEKPKS
ncbi:MAG TPA: methyltransferase domain-containing protein [Hyphomonadaceae bacterium]|nr:methyltransferase domain-containing protein [Hyphomonadaceae bacterium]